MCQKRAVQSIFVDNLDVSRRIPQEHDLSPAAGPPPIDRRKRSCRLDAAKGLPAGTPLIKITEPKTFLGSPCQAVATQSQLA